VAAVAESQVYAALRQVLDPEIGLNVVDLGLVYEVDCADDGDVVVTMTLTTPGCPLHDAIDRAVQRALGRLPGVGRVRVNLVWTPPWNPDMISEAGKAALGWR
jgi:metal-sulfur cluster biosynthetic enzyme